MDRDELFGTLALPRHLDLVLKEELARHTMGPAFPWRYVLYAVRTRFDAIELTLKVAVRDWKTGDPIHINMVEAIPVRVLERGFNDLHYFVESIFRRFVLHELAESHQFDGELLHPPHESQTPVESCS